MAEERHTVNVTIDSPLELTKADIVFEVRRDDVLLGTLYVSRGAVAWKPRYGKKNYRFPWSKFDEVMRGGYRTSGK